MIKSLFLFFLWLNNSYYGSSAGVAAQNSAMLLPIGAECIVAPPAGWVPYTVRSTEALVELANRTGVTIEELVAVNCLAAPEVTKALLVLAPKALAPIIPINVVTAQPSVPITTALPEIGITPTLTVTTVTTTPAPPNALSTPVTTALSVTLALSGSLLLLPTPEPVTVTDANPTFWSVNGLGGISALILVVLFVLRDSIRNLQGRWQRFYLILNRLLLPLLLIFLLLVVIRLIGVL